MMTDPIADMLTRIRNAAGVRRVRVTLPSSNIKRRIAEILQEEGYLSSVQEEVGEGGKRTLSLDIKYLPNGTTPVLRGLKRESKPGQRKYVSVAEIPRVRSGLGVAILSTSKGILTDRDARKENVGGEFLCSAW